MAIKLLINIPNAVDSTSYYRGIGPIAQLRKVSSKDIDLLTTREADVTWATLSMMDAVFLQRPYTRSHLEIVKMAKRYRRPVWVDYDDYLFGVPTDNPCYETYAGKDTRSNIANILQLADVVTVSTMHLKRLFEAPKNKPKRIYVVPNAYNDYLQDWGNGPKAHNLITWRGTNTHQRDLAVFADQIIAASNEHPAWGWSFIGWNPWFATERMPHKGTTVISAIPVDEYFDFMRETQPAIHVVPLDDSHFNRAKSNIAWIEAAWAGAAVLAPDWEEWRRPGVVTYKDPDDFKVQLGHMIEAGPEKLREFNRLSATHIQDHLKLSHVNTARRDILDAMLGQGNWPKAQETAGELVELE